MNLDQIAGVAHEPEGAPQGVVVLTHGAGGNRDSVLLQQVCDEWARRGWLAVRYNLPYRRRRPKGPPSGSAAADQAGIVEAIDVVPRPCRRPADRRRTFLRRPADIDGGGGQPAGPAEKMRC